MTKKMCNGRASSRYLNKFSEWGYRPLSVPTEVGQSARQRKAETMAKQGKDRGATLIETALVLPMLLLLVFGIWTAARAWNVRNTMEHAAREAVRFAATELPWDANSPNDVRDVIDDELNTSAIPAGSVTTVCIDRATNPCGFDPTSQGYTQVAVQIQYPNYPLNFLFFSTTVNFDVEAVGRYEG